MTVRQLRPAGAPAGAPNYRMVARGAERGEIFLYGIIGLGKDNWIGLDGITAKQFADDLRKLGAVKTIDLRINSDGGVVDDARAIYTLLVQHPATIVTHIDGIAASAASFVAMAGQSIAIAEGGFIMIHNARGGYFGTAEDFERQVQVLREYDSAIRNTYAARTGKSQAQLKTWMDDETWFTAAEAVAAGFADSIVADMKAVAVAIAKPERFRHLPASLRPNRAKAAALLGAGRP